MKKKPLRPLELVASLDKPRAPSTGTGGARAYPTLAGLSRAMLDDAMRGFLAGAALAGTLGAVGCDEAKSPPSATLAPVTASGAVIQQPLPEPRDAADIDPLLGSPTGPLQLRFPGARAPEIPDAVQVRPLGPPPPPPFLPPQPFLPPPPIVHPPQPFLPPPPHPIAVPGRIAPIGSVPIPRANGGLGVVQPNPNPPPLGGAPPVIQPAIDPPAVRGDVACPLPRP